jgi:hypothetical protein
MPMLLLLSSSPIRVTQQLRVRTEVLAGRPRAGAAQIHSFRQCHASVTDFLAHISSSVAHGSRVERRASLPVLDFAPITWNGIAESRGDPDT